VGIAWLTSRVLRAQPELAGPVASDPVVSRRSTPWPRTLPGRCGPFARRGPPPASVVLIAGLPGSAYTPGQMTYDLRRLRLNGLIRRLPHTNRYTLTGDGIRIAVFYTKACNRLLVPLTAANQPQAPPELRAALAVITRHVDDYATRARLPAPPENLTQTSTSPRPKIVRALDRRTGRPRPDVKAEEERVAALCGRRQHDQPG
jgi:hypothetical protein